MADRLLTIAEAIERIRPLDLDVKARAEARQATLTKPPGSLGRLEALSVQLAGVFGTETPRVRDRVVVVAAGDHGVVSRGVTGYPQEVTAQMVMNFLAGGAAVSVMCRNLRVQQVIVDAGVSSDLPDHPELRVLKVGRGTADISRGPAMTKTQADRCVLEGINLAVELAEAGNDLIATGDMGIGNTTASSAITSAITGLPPQETTGAGTGRTPEELEQKIGVVGSSLDVNAPDPNDGLDVLAKVGGFEIGVLAGVILGGAMMRRAVVIDGFISGAAALIAHQISSSVIDYLIPAHVSAERGHRALLSWLGLSPLLDLDMRLGEGTGAVIAMPIIDAAAACLSEMATFADAGVSDRDSDTGPANDQGP